MASVKTNIGREKLASAYGGTTVLKPITKIAVGSGGINTDQLTPKSLTGAEVGLYNKVLEKTATVSYPNSKTARYVITINADTDNLVGVNINEAALIDSDGVYIAIKTFTNKGLEAGTVLEIDYDAEF